MTFEDCGSSDVSDEGESHAPSARQDRSIVNIAVAAKILYISFRFSKFSSFFFIAVPFRYDLKRINN